MFGIKIDFYRLIWLNKNIKKIVIFRTRQTPKNAFSEKYFSEKWLPLNHFTTETILRRNKRSISYKLVYNWFL